MNDEMFRLSLIDVMNEGLLNDFVNDIFGYDFDIKKKEYVYIQYKVLGDNIILNIFLNIFHIPVYGAKLVTECILFALS